MNSGEIKHQRSINLRVGMDIGMGLFYAIIGVIVVYYKTFGKMDVPPYVAYVLGTMMIIGGCARLYRGIKAILPQKEKDEPNVNQ